MQIVTSAITIECPHCGHELSTEREISFGVDIGRCLNCKKFVKIETFAHLTRIKIDHHAVEQIVTMEEEAESI